MSLSSQPGLKPTQTTTPLLQSPKSAKGIWRIDVITKLPPGANIAAVFDLAPPPGHTMQVQLLLINVTNNGAGASRIVVNFVVDNQSFVAAGNIAVLNATEARCGFGVGVTPGTQVTAPATTEAAVAGLPDIWIPKPFQVNVSLGNGAYSITEAFMMVETRPYPVQN